MSPPRFGRSTFMRRTRTLRSLSGASPPPDGRTRRLWPTTPRACSWRRCGSSPTIGRTITTGAKCEARLNSFPNFLTEIDGLDIHFIHVRSQHANALPIIVTHGWPGSIVEQLKIVEPLTDPTAYGGTAKRRVRRRHSVDARLRLLGQADRAGWNPPRIVNAWMTLDEAARLCALRGAGRRLGRADDRDHGRNRSARADRDPHQHGIHRRRRKSSRRCVRETGRLRT